MKAASVVSFGSPPEFVDLPAPSTVGAHDLSLDVLAVGLHPIVRAQADGSHYTSPRAVPFIPGIDGVGYDTTGELRYFISLGSKDGGTMAEQVVMSARHTVPLPPDADPVAVAASMNPAMSAWLALRARTQLHAGQDVLVLGATGASGRMAVRIAALLGARKVIAAGRDSGRLAELPALGATDVVAIGETRLLGTVAADVDIVLDYVWGTPTAAIMAAIAAHRRDPGHQLTWVEIGSAAGPGALLPSAALRSCRIDILGSGRGALNADAIVAGLADLAGPVAAGELAVEAEPRPLADVAQSWQDAARLMSRIVFVPGRTTPSTTGART
ncbi:NADPH:quinone reductase-like Zn-dependent oxidoreductase [Streptomyces sp. SAI-135]|jgi:NADPH:quinone reductase-like Zn-dependent oxidoreductase|uniref:quinone oxidoreductase family protein n=1 Tax=unclassified Streptomyces TaxID=2593676 RepID=UPI002473CCCC|nr:MULTISPECIES: zinc-binding alcohol dehydrogenase family protein [unclassified Streptomyces]MDH6523455.1 NADPH:quinone reductase-like Zn-dependent oxidoreductase [Streptomyces sp. SAI-090]MDH6555075.1 NADPH:quinone reductase-like Zn-dependent oxidoreductase [Streptomyces sp. SAI-041]MDH6574348.1 NADPH:quinone reductase-like Zn-dependent oxidoreductase [Streptomyces sp. SAI-117]MDH6580928.1 NADPH:quinone reductase-like Zn-dependent oxidoreductase [Streptomyces sp. SAI-133]MDH6612932.1 NADPH:q